MRSTALPSDTLTGMSKFDAKGAPLVREVLRPYRARSGVGVIVVAASAMFFAVGSSALIVHARMSSDNGGCPARALPAAQSWQAAPSPDECGRASFVANEDGSETVYFRACEPAQTMRAPQAQALDGYDVIEVEIR